MAITTVPPPIPGKSIDPPPKQAPDKVKELDAQDGAVGTSVGVGFRAYTRFAHAKATLLAAGTTYYLFLAMFSVIAFGYGLTAALGADQIASYMTEAIGEAFPGLLGDEGIDAAQLQSVGQTTSIVGLIGLLYGGTGGVIAAQRSIHQVYGAPKDSRNLVVARLRALGWLVVIGPLIMLSFVATSFTSNVSDAVLDALGIDVSGAGILLPIAAFALTLGVNYLIVYLLLANLGGIRPSKRSLVIGSAVGAVVIEILKTAMGLLISFTIDKPQYGALAAPIGILFVLFLQSLTVYACAALTAGIAEKDVPLEVLEPDAAEDAQAAIEDATDEVEVVPGDAPAVDSADR